MNAEFAKEVEQILERVLNGGEKRPDFIGKVTVSNFSFGDVPPGIEILDMTEPYEEFYIQPLVSQPYFSSTSGVFGRLLKFWPPSSR